MSMLVAVFTIILLIVSIFLILVIRSAYKRKESDLVFLASVALLFASTGAILLITVKLLGLV